jgi:hypothetical protein
MTHKTDAQTALAAAEKGAWPSFDGPTMADSAYAISQAQIAQVHATLALNDSVQALIRTIRKGTQT